MNLVERFRGAVLERVIAMPSFAPDWPARRDFLKAQLGPLPALTPRRLVEELGNNLSGAFRTVGAGRTQEDVTNAGAVWHCLVTLYLNIVYAGTEAVAVTAPFAPKSVKDSMNVSYGGTSLKGDLDVALLVLPGTGAVADPPAPNDHRRRLRAVRDYQTMFDGSFDTAYVCLIACKTNWNDAVQAPMLWNLLYALRAAGGTLPPGMSIGTGGFSLDQLGASRFSTAFVTVPTNGLNTTPPRARYTATAMPVQRMRTMTGGYYWGYPKKTGVVDNVHEFPDRQAARSPVVPRAADGGIAFLREWRTPSGDVDIDGFDWA